MTEGPHFEPVFPSHAVERCGATITYAQELPTKAFQKASEKAQTIFRSAGLDSLGSGAIAPIGIEIDALTGKATPITGPAPVIFTTRDKATQFVVSTRSLTVRTGGYVRWEPFVGQIDELLLPLHELYADIIAIQSLQLDYTDRFRWTGDWANFDWRSLLREDGKFVTGRAAAVSGPWHSHSGWFENVPGVRRLANVNIDLGDNVNPASGISFPSVAILTLLRDDLTPSQSPSAPLYADGPSIQRGLEQLHNGLKTLLEQIITVPMAERIGLKAPPDVTHH